MSNCKKSLIIAALLMTTLMLFCSCNKKAPDEAPEPIESMPEIITTTDIPTTVAPTFTASTADTDTLTVDGVLYRSNFQNGMVLSDVYDNSFEEIESSEKFLYRVKAAPFDMLYDPDPIATRILDEKDIVYCRDDQWQELHAYYSNSDNYDYSYICVDKYNNLDVHPISDPDKEKFDKLIEWCKENHYNPVNAVTNPQLPHPVLNDEDFIRYRFAFQTKDRMFSNGTDDFYLQNGKLSLIYNRTMLTGTTLVIDVPDDMARYFIELVNGA